MDIGIKEGEKDEATTGAQAGPPIFAMLLIARNDSSIWKIRAKISRVTACRHKINAPRAIHIREPVISNRFAREAIRAMRIYSKFEDRKEDSQLLFAQIVPPISPEIDTSIMHRVSLLSHGIFIESKLVKFWHMAHTVIPIAIKSIKDNILIELF